MLAGAAAGICVDISLFPIDTIKTRLQSERGFFRSGGFRGVYSGLGSVAVGSAPSAALFFCTYDAVKRNFGSHEHTSFLQILAVYMTAASLGEVMACTIRVPVEVVKQRAQASFQNHRSSVRVLSATLRSEGPLGLYRGFRSTLLREIPFSLTQFTLWELLKDKWSSYQEYSVSSWQSSVCGAVSGGIAAALTTPLDVAKTRIMLANKDSEFAQDKIHKAMKMIYQENGFRGLFAGMVPRVIWISIGGAIFLGVYDKTINVINS
ncbi:SLC25A26 (predicted) [Pycnogonum litorale]